MFRKFFFNFIIENEIGKIKAFIYKIYLIYFCYCCNLKIDTKNYIISLKFDYYNRITRTFYIYLINNI